MKISVFVSIAKAVSSWLHGEGSAHFRTYTYPRIKQLTRKYIDLGIYEQIERFYKIVDDTFYKGDIDLDVITPIQTLEFEQRALLDDQKDGAIDSVADTLPKFSSIKDKLYIYKGLEQGNTYRCATFTFNNMLRTAMLKKGLKPGLEVTAIDPLYIETKAGAGKEGTIVDHAFNWLQKNGFPIPSWEPRMTNHDKELSALESSKTIRNAKNFSAKVMTGRIERANSFEEAIALDRRLPDNWEMQVSISFSASLKYFGQIVPFVEKVNGKYSFTRTGGHSIHGIRNSFSIWEDGEAGFGIIESAYRRSEDGFRFLKAKLMSYGIIQIRFVEFNLDGVIVAPETPNSPTTPTSPVDVLLTANIQFGDRGDAVKALQTFLINEGWNIPSGATGLFGKETQNALKAWQDNQFGQKYDGRFWGVISQNRLREIINKNS